MVGQVEAISPIIKEQITPKFKGVLTQVQGGKKFATVYTCWESIWGGGEPSRNDTDIWGHWSLNNLVESEIIVSRSFESDSELSNDALFI